jgi:hypothetical protein
VIDCIREFFWWRIRGRGVGDRGRSRYRWHGSGRRIDRGRSGFSWGGRGSRGVNNTGSRRGVSTNGVVEVEGGVVEVGVVEVGVVEVEGGVVEVEGGVVEVVEGGIAEAVEVEGRREGL